MEETNPREEEREAAAAADANAEQPAAEAPADQDEAVAPEVEQVDPEASGDAAEAEEDLDSEGYELRDLEHGSIIPGTVVQVNPNSVLVDVGYKSEGLIPMSELELEPGQTPEDILAVGDELDVFVLSVDGQERGLLLSQSRAIRERAWEHLIQAHETGDVIEGQIVEEVKGGLLADVGIRAFMPASHVERGYVSDLSVYVGKTVRMRVIELDRAKNRAIVSQKEVLEDEYQGLREETLDELEPGEVREGVVKGITDFGAFVDLGGVDGLLHVSEMSWGRVDHPGDVVELGQKIKVMVLKVNRDEEKISLGLKQILPDPWEDVAEKYPEGNIIDGKVKRLVPFGAFVELEPGVEGLVHISQLAHFHVHEPSEVLSEGETISVKVLRVQPNERRISLSLKEARQDEPQPKRRESKRGDSVMLGEVFGDLLEETRERLNDEEGESEPAGDDEPGGSAADEDDAPEAPPRAAVEEPDAEAVDAGEEPDAEAVDAEAVDAEEEPDAEAVDAEEEPDAEAVDAEEEPDAAAVDAEEEPDEEEEQPKEA